MKIEFGCGSKPRMPGFKTCDIRDLPGVDYVCPAWEIDHFVQPNSVDEIFSRHFFEHLTYAQGERLLQSWFSILKPGAKMHMMLPNLRCHFRQWAQGDMTAAIAGLYGWQRGEFEDLWDVHKSGYDFELLQSVLKKYNYINIKSLKSAKNKHLYVECYKPST